MSWLSRRLGYQTYIPDLEAHRRHDEAVMARVLERHPCVWVYDERIDRRTCAVCGEVQIFPEPTPVTTAEVVFDDVYVICDLRAKYDEALPVMLRGPFYTRDAARLARDALSFTLAKASAYTLRVDPFVYARLTNWRTARQTLIELTRQKPDAGMEPAA